LKTLNRENDLFPLERLLLIYVLGRWIDRMTSLHEKGFFSLPLLLDTTLCIEDIG